MVGGFGSEEKSSPGRHCVGCIFTHAEFAAPRGDGVITAILFDLDGTLVDSAPGILSGFRTVLAAAGIAPVEAIDSRVIGPPLRSTLARLSGLHDAGQIEHLANAFITVYDTEGVLNAKGYPGAADLLAQLVASGRAPFIVTNKRLVPARIMAERLGLAPHLAGLYSLDSFSPPAAKKGAVVAHVLAEHGIAASAAVLVGDSIDDAEAAAANGVPFIAATYGYGAPLTFPGIAPAATLDQLADLPRVLRGLE